MKKSVKKKDHEKLSDNNIKHVSELLKASPPITKKEACSILNISYNTTRLAKILEEWESDKEYRNKKKSERRGKPVSKEETGTVVEMYLGGNPINDIARRIFRSAAFVKNVIHSVGVPTRITGSDRGKTELLPDECIAENFDVGEIAWSANYHTSCEIMARLDDSYIPKYLGPCYRVWVREPETNSEWFGTVQGGFYAYIPAYDLGKLEHLREYGVNVSKL